MTDKSIKIDANLHRTVKVKAAEEGRSIVEWITDAIREKFWPSKRERILDAFAVNPLLKDVYDQIPYQDRGVGPSAITRKICEKNPRIPAGRIYEALEELKDLEAIREIPLDKEPSKKGDNVVYRRLDW